MIRIQTGAQIQVIGDGTSASLELSLVDLASASINPNTREFPAVINSIEAALFSGPTPRPTVTGSVISGGHGLKLDFSDPLVAGKVYDINIFLRR